MTLLAAAERRPHLTEKRHHRKPDRDYALMIDSASATNPATIRECNRLPRPLGGSEI